jgi:hypothetical protein
VETHSIGPLRCTLPSKLDMSERDAKAQTYFELESGTVPDSGSGQHHARQGEYWVSEKDASYGKS